MKIFELLASVKQNNFFLQKKHCMHVYSMYEMVTERERERERGREREIKYNFDTFVII